MISVTQSKTAILGAVIYFLSGVFSAHADENFLIKGRYLGQDSQTACGGSEVRSSLDKTVTQARANLPALKMTNSTSCDVKADSFAEQKIDGEISLLFVDNKLIQVKFELEPLDWQIAAQVYIALTQAYGKSRRDNKMKADGLMTDTWTKKGQALTLHWQTLKNSDRALEIVLRDVNRFTEFKKIIDHNTTVFQRADDAKTVRDIK